MVCNVGIRVSRLVSLVLVPLDGGWVTSTSVVRPLLPTRTVGSPRMSDRLKGYQVRDGLLTTVAF